MYFLFPICFISSFPVEPFILQKKQRAEYYSKLFKLSFKLVVKVFLTIVFELKQKI